MTERFTEAEVQAIRKLAKLWADAGGIDAWVSAATDGYASDCGFVGIGEKGELLFTEFDAVSEYDGYTLDRTAITISPRALSDPEGWAAHLTEQKEQAAREYEARRVNEMRQREAQERATYEALKAKFG